MDSLTVLSKKLFLSISTGMLAAVVNDADDSNDDNDII